MSYAEDGYEVVRGAIPIGLAAACAGYLTGCLKRGTETDPRGHFSIDVRLSELLLRPALHLAMTKVIHRFLGVERLYLHMPPMARFVPSGDFGPMVPAHQDVSYNRHLGHFCVVWMPLTEIDAASGGIRVYPASHKRGELPNGHVGSFTRQWHPAIETMGMERVELQPLSPGDIVVLDDHVVHESLPNVSKRVRLSLDYRFFPQLTDTTRNHLDVG